ncbi:ComEA family DNA-binding protein [Vulgatibacter incomptus]|uniref:Late competence protein ComEA, DNA receptor n=1 Tax=Vulgatibacter incomptus TaxID=1391653 RepID=A0A0K1PAH8_9BACT|nr:helix-hairpin-helix domain-containing protein [Vulgatibacter incomptus]AKU90507.1 hypothetical protein AKJ08_0894 [Vulgatibacter incomptus]
MDFRGCVAAIGLLAGIVALALWPRGSVRPIPSRCADSGRLERMDPERLRGAVPVLDCPDTPCDACRAPGGEGALLLGLAVDVDRAEEEELRALPGIGRGLAGRIVAERDRRGPFGSLDGLARVKGLGPARIGVLRGWAVANGGIEGAREGLDTPLPHGGSHRSREASKRAVP